MPEKHCCVFIPAKFDGGFHNYNTHASSSFESAWQAIQQHESAHHITLADDVIVLVVVNGKNGRLFGYTEHNAKQPNYWHRVRQVRLGLAVHFGKL